MEEKIYIAGAHSRATTMGHYLQYLSPNIKIIAYLYDNDEKNPEFVGDIPVYKIDKNSELDLDAIVYLGTRTINHSNLIKTLTECGIKKIVPVDVRLDLDIRNRYLKKYYASIGREYLKIDDYGVLSDAYLDKYDKKACVYVASSAFDKPLLKDKYSLKSYEKIIQVGTQLAESHIDATYYDNAGDNISDKNTQFCELTGLYWIWKNAVEDVVGLVHYRRHFILPNDWIARMEKNNIDVILPIPLYVGPNLEANFRKRHEESVWDAVISILKQQDNNEEASSFFKETALYYPCNMFIMRKEVLDDLCKWMFPILFRLVEKCGVLDDTYQNRYPGFVSERLITYFFEKNRNKYKLVYADKNFLQ